MKSLKSPTFSRITAIVRYSWIAFLAYVVVGGAIVQILSALGDIGQHCADASQQDGIYPNCEPCSFYWSIFGLVEISNCPDAFLTGALNAVSFAQFIVVGIAIFTYPIVEFLEEILPFHSAVILMPALMAICLRILYFNFYNGRAVWRGIHRALLVSWLMLAILTAIEF